MKYKILTLLILLSNSAYSAVNNGSFETNDYTGWTLLEASGSPAFGTWGIAANNDIINNGDTVFDYFDNVNVVQTSPTLPITYLATDGGFLAYQLQNDSERHRMYQDISLETTATVLHWDMMYTNTNVDFSNNQFLAVHIRDTSDVILETLFITNLGDALSVNTMTAFNADISAYAGTTIRLDIEMNVQNSWLDAAFDNFRYDLAVPATAIPTLSTWGLLALSIFLFAFAGYNNKRKET